MDLINNDEKDCIKDLLNLNSTALQDILRNFENPSKEKYQNILVKLLIIQAKSTENNLELLLKQLEPNQDENIQLVTMFAVENQNIFSENKTRFVDLNWRLESKVCSRSVRELDEFEPKILLNIAVQQDNTKKFENIYMSPRNLNHIIHKLEQVLADSKNIVRKQ